MPERQTFASEAEEYAHDSAARDLDGLSQKELDRHHAEQTLDVETRRAMKEAAEKLSDIDAVLRRVPDALLRHSKRHYLEAMDDLFNDLYDPTVTAIVAEHKD